ncbi:MAG: hypothetical protein ACK41D_04190 [Rubricoccaceae bacterium]
MAITPHFRFFALIPLVALAACEPAELSSNVNQDRIWARYELVYDGQNDRTEPRASFRFGNGSGTQLRLDGDARVQFEGRTLELQTPLNVTFYSASLNGRTAEGTFRYTNADGRVFENRVSNRALSLPGTLPDIRRGQPYTVTWQGEPVGPNEEVRLVLYRVSLDSRLAFASATQAGATSVTIPPAQTQPIQPGEITVLLTRFTRGTPAQATSAGGETVGEYNAPQRLGRVVD